MGTLIRNLLVMFNEHADVNYIGGQGNYHNMGFNQNFENHQNLLSYRSNNMENPKDQIYPVWVNLITISSRVSEYKPLKLFI